MLRLTLAQARRSIGRLSAAGIAIAIGTAFIAATLLTASVMTRTTEDALLASLAQADLIVSGPDFTPERIAAVGQVPGVAAVEAPNRGFLQVSGGGRLVFQPWVTVAADPRLQAIEVTDGRPPAVGEVAVPTPTADRLGLAIGDTLVANVDRWDPETEQFTQEPETLTVSGIVTDPSGAFVATDGALLVTAEDAQRWEELADVGNMVNRLLLLTTDDATVGTVQSAVTEAFDDPDVAVRTRSEQTAYEIEQTGGAANVLTALVLAFGAIALIVASLVIANTFNVLVAQRTRDLALLRCVGASKRQLRRSVRLEALLLGVAASVTGIVSGIALAQGALSILGRVVSDVPLPATVEVGPAVVLVPFVAGVLVTLLAATVPARAAGRVSPLAAMRPADAPSVRSRGSRRRLVLSVAMTVVGLVLLVLGMIAGTASILLGLGLGILGGLLSFVGVLVGAVFWVPRLVAFTGRTLARRAGPAAELAAANTIRNPQRTAVTSAALLIGVTLVAMMSTGAETARAGLEAELDREYPVDAVIRSVDVSGDGLAEADIAAVERLSGVDQAVAMRGAGFLLSGEGGTEVYGRGFGADPEEVSALVRRGLADDLDARTVIVPEALAEIGGIVDGDTLRVAVELPDGTTGASAELTAKVTALPGTQVLLASDTFESLAPEAPIDTTWVRLDSNGDAVAAMADIQELFSTQAVDVGGLALERAQFDQLIDTLLAIVIGLLGVAVVIALVGVANTLSLSVIERRKESATLRAIGLTRRQLRQTLAIEGMLIAGSGAVIGTALGAFYGWAGARTVLGELASDVPLVLPWWHLLVVLVVALAAGLLASVLPGRRAARTSPVAALAME